MKEHSHECPVCGFRLKGDRFTGYTCLRCSSHYSAKFIGHLRRQHFKGIISKHFDMPAPAPAAVEETEEQFLVPAPVVREAIEEAKEAAGKAVQHLEDILDATSSAQESIDEVGIAAGSMAVGRITGFIEPVKRKASLAKLARGRGPQARPTRPVRARGTKPGKRVRRSRR